MRVCVNMVNKHPKKFCSIQRWLEKEHPDLAEVVRDLCAVGQLSGRHGATFLCPDAATRKQIIKVAYSEDPEKAVATLQAHVIPSFAEDAATLKRLSDEGALGSRAGTKLSVKSVDGDKVTITSDDGKHSAVVTPDRDFKPLNRELSVWNVESGSISSEDNGFKPKTRRAVKGGGDASTVNRAQIAEVLKSQMMQHLSGVGPNPYTSAVCALLECAGASAQALGPLLDYNPITSLYLLLEPSKTSGTCCLSDACVTEFMGKLSAGLTPCSYEQYLQKMREACGGRCSDGVRFYLDASSAAANELKNHYVCRKEIAKIYQNEMPEFLKTLGIPSEMISPEKKLWQDEIRFSVAAMLASGRPLNAESFTEVIEFMDLHPGNDFAAECDLTKCITGKELHMAPTGEMTCLTAFIHSTALMYSAWDDTNVQEMITVDLREAISGKIFSLQRSAFRVFATRSQ